MSVRTPDGLRHKLAATLYEQGRLMGRLTCGLLVLLEPNRCGAPGHRLAYPGDGCPWHRPWRACRGCS